MKKIAFWVDSPYCNDALFEEASPLNRDNCLSAYRILRESLRRRGWECGTQDVYKSGDVIPDAVLFLEMPKHSPSSLLGQWEGRSRKLIMLLECEVIRPWNWRPGSHEEFDAVFTWDERLIDNKKYFKVNFPNIFPGKICCDIGRKTGFCVTITGNRKARHPLELYSEREKSVSWFESRHPEEFDLYGFGWDRYFFCGPLPLRALNRIKPLTRFLAPGHPSYRGNVSSKRPVLEKYRFSICYENAKEIPGYITEKIFDCFFAGCIPVYWGAPDIGRYVPEECFIDRRKFTSHEELYSFLKKMTDCEFRARLEAIKSFLAGPQSYQFSDRYFAETIAGVVADG